MTSAAPRVEYPHEGGTEPQPRRGAWRSQLVPLVFIAPAAVFLFVPALVTAVGLIFAVLTERVRWATAFKIVVFMPLAVSLFAVGVIWRIMYQEDPERGAINAGIVAVQGIVSESGVITRASPSTETLTGSEDEGFTLQRPIGPGGTAALGLTAIRTPEIPEDAQQAVQPEPLQGGITGVVWRDFKPGGGEAGVVESE